MHRPILFHDPTSEPSRAVHWFALEAGIDLEIRYTWLTRGEHRRPEFLKINPAHQVPALLDGDLPLTEAAAIMIHLAETRGVDDRWIGADPASRARTHQLLSWHHTNTRTRITLDYVLPVLLMPAYNGSPSPTAVRRSALRDLAAESLGLLEARLTAGGPWLGGEAPNLADPFISSDLFALDADPERALWLDPFPGLSAWLERLRERPACAQSLAMWERVTPRIRDLVTASDGADRNPGWVRDSCLGSG